MRTTWKKIRTETKRGGSDELSRFFVLGLMLLVLLSCSEQKPETKMDPIENILLKKSFINFVLPIIESFDVQQLRKWDYAPYDLKEEKVKDEFEIFDSFTGKLPTGCMLGRVTIDGAQLTYLFQVSVWKYAPLELTFFKTSEEAPWRLHTDNGHIADADLLIPPEVEMYIKSKFETIPNSENFISCLVGASQSYTEFFEKL